MTSEGRFDPLKEFQSFSEHVTKQVEKGIRSVTGSSEQLSIDMYEADDHLYIVTHAIDGLVKESIEISLESNILTIAVQTEPEATPTSARYLLQERRFGPITRQVELSIPVKGNEARAKVEGGSRLIVSLPIDSSIYGNIKVTPVE